MKNFKNKKIFLFLVFFLLPILTFAQTFAGIPCDGGAGDPCDFNKLMELVSNVINYIILLAFPLAVISFAYTGLIYMTTGIVDKKSEAKKMLWKVVQGFAILLAAWLIVKTILVVLLNDSYFNSLPIQF